MITQRALVDFRPSLRGDVLLAHDGDYDATRRIFNANDPDNFFRGNQNVAAQLH